MQTQSISGQSDGWAQVAALRAANTATSAATMAATKPPPGLVTSGAVTGSSTYAASNDLLYALFSLANSPGDIAASKPIAAAPTTGAAVITASSSAALSAAMLRDLNALTSIPGVNPTPVSTYGSNTLLSNLDTLLSDSLREIIL